MLDTLLVGIAFVSLMFFHGLVIWMICSTLSFLTSGGEPLTERERRDLIYSNVTRRQE